METRRNREEDRLLGREITLEGVSHRHIFIANRDGKLSLRTRVYPNHSLNRAELMGLELRLFTKSVEILPVKHQPTVSNYK